MSLAFVRDPGPVVHQSPSDRDQGVMVEKVSQSDVRRHQCNNPKIATLLVVPMNTLPSATVGVMNLLPTPK